MIISAILIKATSDGPVIFAQERVGLHNKPFQMYKFRTMIEQTEAEEAKGWTTKDDPRVTRFGKFLRKTSLDELPQLLNVLRGEMAFIGPRPIVTKEIALYGADYEILKRVRPGITGLWQCSGRSDVDYARRVALDTYYILNWSPWMDVWIFIKTIGAVLFMRGVA